MQPRGVRFAAQLLFLMSSSPLQRQKAAPTLRQADEVFEKGVSDLLARLDANDLLYAVESSFDYDPGPDLERIRAPLLAVNFADDLINLPELGILEREPNDTSPPTHSSLSFTLGTFSLVALDSFGRYSGKQVHGRVQPSGNSCPILVSKSQAGRKFRQPGLRWRPQGLRCRGTLKSPSMASPSKYRRNWKPRCAGRIKEQRNRCPRK
jgi:hypothetical protein